MPEEKADEWAKPLPNGIVPHPQDVVFRLELMQSGPGGPAGVHAGYLRVRAMVLLACKTDFTARNDEFVKLANQFAMHVAADAILGDKEKGTSRIGLEGSPSDYGDK